MSDTQPEVTKENYPSIDLIYPLAIASYETSRQRMITQDARIHRLITLTLAITAGIPASYQLFGVCPTRIPLIFAFVFFAVGILLLVVASAKNSLHGTSISVLYDHYLHISEFRSKAALIKYAGEADEADEKRRSIRYRLITCATACLGIEVIIFLLSGLGLNC